MNNKPVVSAVIDLALPLLVPQMGALKDLAARVEPSEHGFVSSWNNELAQSNVPNMPRTGALDGGYEALVGGLARGDGRSYINGVATWSAEWRARGGDFPATLKMLTAWRRAFLPILVSEYLPGPELENVFRALDVLEQTLGQVLAASEIDAARQGDRAVVKGATPAVDDFLPSHLARWVRILVVDDEPMVRDVATRSFELRGFQTISAESGADAVRVFAEKGPFEVVVIDLEMPMMNGLDTARAIKELYPRTITILMTGWSAEADAKRAGQSAIDCTIPKPFDVNQVIELVSRELVSQEKI